MYKRQREVCHADISQPHRAYRRRVQKLPGAPLQTLGRQRGMAVSGGIGKRAIGADSRPLSCGKRKEEDAMDKEKGTIYLAYGSNLNLKQMACRCPTAQVLGSAKLTGYRLFFRGGNGGAVATIERQKGGICLLYTSSGNQLHL